ncbi:MAG: GMC family oxidoreductase [Dongiaceae bacterium]
MIEDADGAVENGARLAAAICIIGGGAAGITLALELARSRDGILLLEGGGPQPEPASQALYEGETDDAGRHEAPDRYRQRCFGGATTIWTGRCLPLDPIDFERRPYMPGSGWPLRYEDLLPYYERANQICEAGPFAYRAADALPGQPASLLEGFAGGSFAADRIERFSRPTDFGKRYRGELAASRRVRVLLHANCTELHAAAGAIERVGVQTLAGRSFEVAAGAFVLAVGGLETPRLMLASRRQRPEGVGNERGLVGRFYMCHIAGTLGDFRPSLPRSGLRHAYARSPEGVYCRRRFALTAEAQRSHQIGNFVARTHHPRIPDPGHRTGALSAIYLGRNLIPYEITARIRVDVGRRKQLAHVRNLVLDPWSTTLFMGRMLYGRRIAKRKLPTVVVWPRSRHFSFDFSVEQQPNPDSRIVLTERRDALGMPRLRVEWRHSELDLRTVRTAFTLLAEDIAASDCGGVALDDALSDEAILRDGAQGGHHIGTARMSDSPATGVVDRSCRVHGLGNLFVAGSAVFPTSGQANPTLTIVALALRLADHLAQQAWTVAAAGWI